MALEGRKYNVSELPALTRLYLFQLIVDGTNGLREILQQDPDGIAGDTVKFGSESGRAPGSEAYNRNRRALREPGRYRIVRHIHRANRKTVWAYAEHTGGNAYRFYEIILPACETCDGSTKVECDLCGGFGVKNIAQRIAIRSNGEPIEKLMDLRRCRRCDGSSFMRCPTCHPPDVVNPRKHYGPNGPYSISINQNRWI